MGGKPRIPMPTTTNCLICGAAQCDCQERILCDKAGQYGHWQCGTCHRHNAPRFQCGCICTIPTHEHNYIYAGQQIIAPRVSLVSHRCACGVFQNETMAPEDAMKLSPTWKGQQHEKNERQS